jgi:hypothetical protein
MDRGAQVSSRFALGLAATYAAELVALRPDVLFDDNTIVVPARQERDTHPKHQPGSSA